LDQILVAELLLGNRAEAARHVADGITLAEVEVLDLATKSVWSPHSKSL
jgi:hypothetical protein